LTPLQRFVYTLAKDHHTDDHDVDTSGVSQAHSTTRGF
jgi:hypothetical protein